ncbi:MAG: UDP-N-acetylmuramoyl-L-alanine--D-glutamate ligase [Breznakia sp.]
MKKVLVIGGARSGSAISRLLIKKGFDVYLSDLAKLSNKEQLLKEGIHVEDGGHPQYLKEQTYAFVVKNPGIPYDVPFLKYFIEAKYEIYTEIEIAYRYAKHFKYGAITGTNGKTTTTTMLHTLLKTSFKSYVAGNIGIPLSEIVLQHEKEVVYVALELSNFQLLGCKQFKPQVSTILNLSPDHLDYMDSLEAYYVSKTKIYENCDEHDYFIRNIDDASVLKYTSNIHATILDISRHQKADIYIKDQIVYLKDVVLFQLKDLNVVGTHNISNAMVAAAMAYVLGVDVQKIQEGVGNIGAVEHRLEAVDTIGEIRFYNDSKATNPEAIIPAIQAFDRSLILLAGGYDKGLSLDILKKYRPCIKKCFAYGETKHKFINIFDTILCKDLPSAFQQAIAFARSGDVILLSPACASYDQFESYEERGNMFKQLVAEYKKGEINE